jgi:hypothetical protein
MDDVKSEEEHPAVHIDMDDVKSEEEHPAVHIDMGESQTEVEHPAIHIDLDQSQIDVEHPAVHINFDEEGNPEVSTDIDNKNEQLVSETGTEHPAITIDTDDVNEETGTTPAIIIDPSNVNEDKQPIEEGTEHPAVSINSADIQDDKKEVVAGVEQLAVVINNVDVEKGNDEIHEEGTERPAISIDVTQVHKDEQETHKETGHTEISSDTDEVHQDQHVEHPAVVISGDGVTDVLSDVTKEESVGEDLSQKPTEAPAVTIESEEGQKESSETLSDADGSSDGLPAVSVDTSSIHQEIPPTPSVTIDMTSVQNPNEEIAQSPSVEQGGAQEEVEVQQTVALTHDEDKQEGELPGVTEGVHSETVGEEHHSTIDEGNKHTVHEELDVVHEGTVKPAASIDMQDLHKEEDSTTVGSTDVKERPPVTQSPTLPDVSIDQDSTKYPIESSQTEIYPEIHSGSEHTEHDDTPKIEIPAVTIDLDLVHEQIEQNGHQEQESEVPAVTIDLADAHESGDVTPESSHPVSATTDDHTGHVASEQLPSAPGTVDDHKHETEQHSPTTVEIETPAVPLDVNEVPKEHEEHIAVSEVETPEVSTHSEEAPITQEEHASTSEAMTPIHAEPEEIKNDSEKDEQGVNLEVAEDHKEPEVGTPSVSADLDEVHKGTEAEVEIPAVSIDLDEVHKDTEEEGEAVVPEAESHVVPTDQIHEEVAGEEHHSNPEVEAPEVASEDGHKVTDNVEEIAIVEHAPQVEEEKPVEEEEPHKEEAEEGEHEGEAHKETGIPSTIAPVLVDEGERVTEGPGHHQEAVLTPEILDYATGLSHEEEHLAPPSTFVHPSTTEGPLAPVAPSSEAPPKPDYAEHGPLFATWTQKPVDQTTEAPHSPEDFQYPSGTDSDYDDEESGHYGPGTCRYGGKVYLSAQQIPRDDPCDFCFCFRSDIICLQQSCPPPIQGCYQETIQGFCCPRYECHVSMATMLNLTTTTTSTTTTLPPHFFPHAYKGAALRTGCHVKGVAYRVGERIPSTSGPCLQCRLVQEPFPTPIYNISKSVVVITLYCYVL